MSDISVPHEHSRQALRQTFRNKRRALSAAQQKKAASRLLLNLSRQAFFKRARHIAFYIANDGEISPHLLINFGLQNNKCIYLPKLTAKNSMSFRAYHGKQQLIKNRFGIPEPKARCHPIAAHQLDLVFLPLVAFDSAGNRLGMGGGFYDRTFSFRQKNRASKPLLIGLAHSCQEADGLEYASWDVPLDYIVTDEALRKVK